jgi:hypothetical protein
MPNLFRGVVTKTGAMQKTITVTVSCALRCGWKRRTVKGAEGEKGKRKGEEK